jgi:hypothetical protein
MSAHQNKVKIWGKQMQLHGLIPVSTVMGITVSMKGNSDFLLTEESVMFPLSFAISILLEVSFKILLLKAFWSCTASYISIKTLSSQGLRKHGFTTEQ